MVVLPALRQGLAYLVLSNISTIEPLTVSGSTAPLLVHQSSLLRLCPPLPSKHTALLAL